MNERFVTRIAAGLTVLLAIFILGFSLGRTPKDDGMLLVSSHPAVDAAAEPDAGTQSNPPKPPGGEDAIAFPINLNTADAALLDTVPGIGPVLAGRIIDYRELAGSFKTVDELLSVNGIGEKTLEKMREYLTVGE